jgi:conjugal transfer pilus assembly protein TraB
MINTTPHFVKKIQWQHLVIVLAVCTLLIGILLYASSPSDKPTSPSAETTQQAFSSPLSRINTESYFMERAEKQVIAAQKAAEDAQKQVQITEQSKQRTLSEDQSKLEQLNQRIAELEQQIHATRLSDTPAASASPASGENMPFEPAEHAPPPSPIRVDTLNLAADPAESTPMKNPDTYVSSGTFAKAVMLGGADASAAVTSQSNPNPMLFRIIDQGTLPNNRRSHLKDCVVTAAVSGDISSERGHIRLETLSCTRADDSIVDIRVKGTVFGPEGKNGIRGQPIWREGALLQRAFASGALSGFSSALSQRYTTTSISPLGATQNVNGEGIWGYGAARGASNAMTKLADYNIKRAEQYHPVIQLSAGTVVDIVFLEGFYLDGRTRNQDNDMLAQPVSAPSLPTNEQPAFAEASAGKQPLPLSPKQIQRLQERSQELGFTRPPSIKNTEETSDNE